MIKILSSSESSSNLRTFIKKVKKSDKKLFKKVLWCRDDTDTSLATKNRNKKIRLRWLSLAAKEMKSKSGWWTSKQYHSNPYICSCIFHFLLLWMYTQILSQTHPPVCGAGCRLLWNFYATTCIQAATDVGIAVIPCWCSSSRFWFHFFCSQWQPPQSYFLIFCSL